MNDFFQTKIEFLKGVGVKRAKLLNDELNIHTFQDLLFHFPYRYEDRTRFYKINQIENESSFVQIKGRVSYKEEVGELRKRRLVVHLRDETGQIELVWFKGINWVSKKIKVGGTLYSLRKAYFI